MHVPIVAIGFRYYCKQACNFSATPCKYAFHVLLKLTCKNKKKYTNLWQCMKHNNIHNTLCIYLHSHHFTYLTTVNYV